MRYLKPTMKPKYLLLLFSGVLIGAFSFQGFAGNKGSCDYPFSKDKEMLEAVANNLTATNTLVLRHALDSIKPGPVGGYIGAMPSKSEYEKLPENQKRNWDMVDMLIRERARQIGIKIDDGVNKTEDTNNKLERLKNEDPELAMRWRFIKSTGLLDTDLSFGGPIGGPIQKEKTDSNNKPEKKKRQFWEIF